MLSLQNASYSRSQPLTASSGLAFKAQIWAVPSLRLATKPAARKRRRCLEIAGRLLRKFAAISPTVRSPLRNRLRISRRGGSPIPPKTELFRFLALLPTRLRERLPLRYQLSNQETGRLWAFLAQPGHRVA